MEQASALWTYIIGVAWNSHRSGVPYAPTTRASLDELPQFFNVLKGEMSAIGPRPLIPGELEAHGGRPLYNKVKPGLTGWWGCNGRSDIEYQERLELEYYYITHCSLYLDALCILRTALAVFKREGAQ